MGINTLERAALRRQLRKQTGSASVGVFGALLVLAAVLAVKGWALMIAWGIAAATLGVATISFWPAVAVAFLLSLAFTTSASAS